MSGLDTNTLELIRRQVFGGPVGSHGAFDYNALFGSNPGVSAQSLNVFAPGAQFDPNAGAGVGEAGNATGHANDPGNTPTAAQGLSMAVNAFSALSSTTPIGIALAVANISQAVQGKPSVANQAFSAIAQALGLSTPDAPESANANDAGLSQAQDSQAAFAAMESDGGGGNSTDGSGDGSSDGGVGTSAGNAGDADGGNGSPDSGDSGGSYAMGGLVPGHDILGKDNKTINVSGGEWVIPTTIVDMLGKNFFEKLMLTKSPLQEEAEKQAKQSQKGSA